MLSAREVEQIHEELDNMPSSITGKNRHNRRATLKKKLTEHTYASQYPPFTPLSHHRYYINRSTTENTLRELIHAAEVSTIFTLDTESIGIYQQPNQPALIQLQILLPDLPIPTPVLLVEVCHLPPPRTPTFDLIRELFQVVLHPAKEIYTWGKINELDKFTRFELFSAEQIDLPENTNLQGLFQRYWQLKHPHGHDINQCSCETCIGMNSGDTWSLQDAVAFELHEWLDKRQTRSSFDIGLDQSLYRLNSAQLEQRELMSRYAADDCLSMEKLLISMQYNPPPTLTSETPTNDIETPIDHIETTTDHDIYEQISSDDNEPNEQHLHSTTPAPTIDRPQELSAEERRRQRNRQCTLKQRARNYRYEIIRRGIDSRFTVGHVKEILRREHIQFTVIQISTSTLTHRTSLYIGIRDRSKLREYETRTRHWFSTDHYNEDRARSHRHHRSHVSDSRNANRH
jgi:hypothetical protein